MLNDLDKSATANLKQNDLREYYRYKKELIDSGDEEQSINDTLTGFIWDITECYDYDDA